VVGKKLSGGSLFCAWQCVNRGRHCERLCDTGGLRWIFGGIVCPIGCRIGGQKCWREAHCDGRRKAFFDGIHHARIASSFRNSLRTGAELSASRHGCIFLQNAPAKETMAPNAS